MRRGFVLCLFPKGKNVPSLKKQQAAEQRTSVCVNGVVCRYGGFMKWQCAVGCQCVGCELRDGEIENEK